MVSYTFMALSSLSLVDEKGTFGKKLKIKQEHAQEENGVRIFLAWKSISGTKKEINSFSKTVEAVNNNNNYYF